MCVFVVGGDVVAIVVSDIVLAIVLVFVVGRVVIVGCCVAWLLLAGCLTECVCVCAIVWVLWCHVVFACLFCVCDRLCALLLLLLVVVMLLLRCHPALFCLCVVCW